MAGYSFRCKDIGMKCDFQIKGASSKDEAMQLAGVHAKMAHGVTSLPPELANKVSAAIKG